MNPHRIIFIIIVSVLYCLSSTNEMIPDISSLLKQAKFSVPNLQEGNMTFDNDTILSILHTILKPTIEDANRIIENNPADLPVSEKCLSSVKKYLLRENLNNKTDEDYSYYYLQKFVWDSSKNKNDVTSFGEVNLTIKILIMKQIG